VARFRGDGFAVSAQNSGEEDRPLLARLKQIPSWFLPDNDRIFGVVPRPPKAVGEFLRSACSASTAEDVDQLSCGAPAAQIGGRSRATVSDLVCAGSRKAHALVGAAAKVPSFLRACHPEARVLPQLCSSLTWG